MLVGEQIEHFAFFLSLKKAVLILHRDEPVLDVSTPLGTFTRTKRDGTSPDALGLRVDEKRRAPGLRRTELAMRAGISVEYLTRIEQGRDRNPSLSVVNGLADALSLDLSERRHLGFLAKIAGGACAGHGVPEPPPRDVGPGASASLALLEPGNDSLIRRLARSPRRNGAG